MYFNDLGNFKIATASSKVDPLFHPPLPQPPGVRSLLFLLSTIDGPLNLYYLPIGLLLHSHSSHGNRLAPAEWWGVDLRTTLSSFLVPFAQWDEGLFRTGIAFA